MDELEIIAQIRLGKKNAFASLVNAYQSKVRGYCFSMLGQRAAAEDAAQEVFVKAYKSLDKFRGDSSFSTWLYKITTNHCRDILRARARRKTLSLDQLIEDRGDQIESLLSASSAAATNLVTNVESRDLINKIFASLSEEYREVVILREVQGLSYMEIAQVLDCSLDAVKARLKRARKEILVGLRHLDDSGDV